MSVLYQKILNSFFKPFHFVTNVLVERVLCFAWTLNNLALTINMVSHYWLIENQSGFTNKSRNAMVLTYDF